jgi:hypothetical protein
MHIHYAFPYQITMLHSFVILQMDHVLSESRARAYSYCTNRQLNHIAMDKHVCDEPVPVDAGSQFVPNLHL